jgi:hypothetical protein
MARSGIKIPYVQLLDPVRFIQKKIRRTFCRPNREDPVRFIQKKIRRTFCRPNREPVLVRHSNVQLAVFKKEVFELDRGNMRCPLDHTSRKD